MSYEPTTDFLALLRQEGSAVELARMPGLDYLLSAMARAGFVTLWSGQEAPTANQASTVWIKPALPSWTAEGVVFLYDADADDFVTATPALWAALLAAPSDYVFQSVTSAADTVNGATTLLAVRRTITVPGQTALMLPAVAARAGRPLRVVDWSTVLATHNIDFDTPDGATIMRRATFSLYSTIDQLAGVTLHPSTDLNGWVIAP
jgi:hypothetical protein